MHFVSFNLVSDNGEYNELIPLYNSWKIKTMLLSTGNIEVTEWDDLLEYCLEHKKETAQFFLDLIDAYEKQHQEGIRADNYVGFFNDIIAECFGKDEDFPTFNNYIGGELCQKFYSEYIAWYLKGKPKTMDTPFISHKTMEEKRIISESAKWIRENISDKTAVEYLKAINSIK